MVPISLAEVMRDLSRQISARVTASGAYAHPSGVGDEREAALLEGLQEILPKRYAITKGKLFDSDGNTSNEFDLIIYDPQDAITPLNVSGRKMIPVETEFGVIEVKSRLSLQDYESASATINSLDCLRRYFEPVPGTFMGLSSDAAKRLASGLRPHEGFPGIGRIWSMIVAFDAPNDDTLGKYLSSFPEYLLGVCIPEREFITTWVHPPGWRGIKCGADALGFLIILILEALTTNARSSLYRPNYSRYRNRFVDALGPLSAWTLHHSARKDA